MVATIAQVRTYADKDSVEHLPFASRTAGRQSKLQLFTRFPGLRFLSHSERGASGGHSAKREPHSFIQDNRSPSAYRRRFCNRVTASRKRPVSTVKLNRI